MIYNKQILRENITFKRERESNWALIRNFLQRFEQSNLIIPPEEIAGVIHGKPGARVQKFLTLYHILYYIKYIILYHNQSLKVRSNFEPFLKHQKLSSCVFINILPATGFRPSLGSIHSISSN